MKPGTVYILQSSVNGRYYIGSTDNLGRRLREHNEGRSSYTKFTRPFRLVFSQDYSVLEKARRIEYRLKKLKRRDIIDKIVANKVITLTDE